MPTDEEIAAQKAEQDAAATAAEEAAAKAKADENPDLGDAGKEAIRKEREARKAAEKERDELKRLADDAAAAKAKAEEDDAKAKGEFEKLANDFKGKYEQAHSTLTTITEARDAALARVQAYEDRDRKTIADGVKDLPDDLKTFDPGPDAPLDARMTWFSKATALAAKRTTDPQRGNGRSPEAANGRDAKADEAARLQFERQTTRSF